MLSSLSVPLRPNLDKSMPVRHYKFKLIVYKCLIHKSRERLTEVAYNFRQSKNESAFSNMFKFFRRKNGLGQKQVADMLKLSLQSVSNWETGLHLPDADGLRAVKAALRLSDSEFRALLATLRTERIRIEDKKLSLRNKWGKAAPEHLVVPLFRKIDVENPAVVPEAVEWRGLYVRKPLVLRDKAVAGYFLEDDSMSPKFKKGEILFMDTSQSKPTINNAFVFCHRNQVYCRRLARKVGSKYLFRATAMSVQPMTIPITELSWIYRVIFNKPLEKIE